MSRPVVDAKYLPERLDGVTALDLGGYDGWAARECVLRGAQEAVCVDSGQWKQYGWNGPTHLPDVRYETSDLLDWKEPADLVILSNVLYHCRHPWLVLEHCRSLTRWRFLIHTWVRDGNEAAWHLYRPGEAHKVSPTVAWLPTVPGLVKLLELCGFTDLQRLDTGGDHAAFLCGVD